MELRDILKNYKDVAHDMGNQSIEKLLESLIDKHENQYYQIPFLGQFSAGKSSTINHILGRELLPAKVKETTAFVTYISYSQEEFAILVMEDGTNEEIPLEKIKLLDNDYVEKSNKKIQSLLVGVDCELLKSGLTFVDTPGLNTIITYHIEITEQILKEAQYMVYVMRGSWTEFDRMEIESIESRNIPVIFVRTYLDAFNRSEENWRQTLLDEQRKIEQELGHPIKYFACTNCLQNESPDYKEEFEKCLSFFANDVSANIAKVFSDATMSRLLPLKDEMQKQLEAQINTLKETSSVSLDEIDKKQRCVETLVRDWNAKLAQQKQAILDKSKQMKSEINTDIVRVVKGRKSSFETKAKESKPDSKSLELLVKSSLDAAMLSLSSSIEQTIQNGSDSLCRTIGDDIQSVSSGLKDIGFDIDCSFDTSVVADYNERQLALAQEFEDRMNQVAIVEQELNNNSLISKQQKDQLQQAILEANQYMKACKQEYGEIVDSYEPVYITKGGQLGNTMEKIGNVLDLAMLVMPSTAWTSIGKWAGKAGKVGKWVQKGANVLAKTDAAKDGLTVLRGLKNAKDYMENGNIGTKTVTRKGVSMEKQKTSVLDYLSLGFWFKKAGDLIDPQSMEIDQEYENLYKQQLQESEDRMRQAAAEREQKIQTLAQLNGAEWASKQKMLGVESDRKQLALEQSRLEADLERNKQSAIKESLTNQAIDQFNQKIDEYSSLVEGKSQKIVDDLISAIVNSADAKVSVQLDTLKSQLADILDKRQAHQDNFEDEISRLKLLLDKLLV